MSKCGMHGLDFYYNRYDDAHISDAFAERLECKFNQIKGECYERAANIVQKNELLIKRLAPILIKRKSIEKDECERLIAELGGIVTK